MIEHHIDIKTPDGLMNTFVVHPEENGPFPVIFFYMDAPGKREELHDMARRFATVGYLVVLPNLYYRRSRDYYLKERTPQELEVMFAHMHSLNANTSRTDTQALLAYVDQNAHADSQKIGAVGYCMSGPIVMWAAADFPDRFQSIASIHGANMVTDAADSPHRSCRFHCRNTSHCAHRSFVRGGARCQGGGQHVLEVARHAGRKLLGGRALHRACRRGD